VSAGRAHFDAINASHWLFSVSSRRRGEFQTQIPTDEETLVPLFLLIPGPYTTLDDLEFSTNPKYKEYNNLI
jgi:hypothetical protein